MDVKQHFNNNLCTKGRGAGTVITDAANYGQRCEIRQPRPVVGVLGRGQPSHCVSRQGERPNRGWRVGGRGLHRVTIYAGRTYDSSKKKKKKKKKKKEEQEEEKKKKKKRGITGLVASHCLHDSR